MALLLLVARSDPALPNRLNKRFRCCLCLFIASSRGHPISSAARRITIESFDPGENYRGELDQREEVSGWRDSRFCKAGPFQTSRGPGGIVDAAVAWIEKWLTRNCALVQEPPLYSNFKHNVYRVGFWFRIQNRQLQRDSGGMQRYWCSGAPRPDDELWSLSEAGDLDKALNVLSCMDQQGIVPSGRSCRAVMMACSKRKALAESKRVHALFDRYGFEFSRVLGGDVLSMLVNCGCLEDGLLYFYKLPHRTVYSWTTIVSGYTAAGLYQEALRMYKCMLKGGFEPDSYTIVALLKACRSVSDVKWIQAEAVKYRCDLNIFVGNSLVDMYLKFGCIVDAQDVFSRLSQQNVKLHTAMLVAYAQENQAGKVLQLYEQLLSKGLTPNVQILISALQACGMLAAKEAGISVDEGATKEYFLGKGKTMHAAAWKQGCDSDAFVGTGLINMYAKCGSIVDAHNVFEGLSRQRVVSWNAVLAAYAHEGQAEKAVQLYERMRLGGVSPNDRTFVSVLQAYGMLAQEEEHFVLGGLSTKAGCLVKGKAIHADAWRKGYDKYVFVCNTLISMYGKCGSMADAQNVFDGLCEQSVVSWNAMMTVYIEQGEIEKVLKLYEQMQGEGVSPNDRTIVSALQACGMVAEKEGPSFNFKSVKTGKVIHADARRTGQDTDVFVGNSLISMFGKCGSILDARCVFDGLSWRDVVSWNAMLAAYAQQGQAEVALQLYDRMWEEGVSPDDRTFVSALQACGIIAEKEESIVQDGQSTKAVSLKRGSAIHADARRKGYDSDVFVTSTLISVYGKCGSILDAQSLFDGLSQRDVVSWNAMLVAYSQQGLADKAWQLYEQMQEEGISADEVTLVCILQACTQTGRLDICMRVHHTLLASGPHLSPLLSNTLIHAYGRCSSMVDAQILFDEMPLPDVVSWTALIAGYAQQGDFTACLKSYEEMQLSGVRPDGVTFLSLLYACSHAGLVEKGVEFFESMTTHHGITPEIEHYVSMVDLLGRAGFFTSIEHLLSTMPMQPNLPLLSCLMGACRKHSKVVLGKQAFDLALSLHPNDSATYVLMSRIYADAGLVDQAMEVKELRQTGGAWKRPGQSWISHEQDVHTFMVGDHSHRQQEQVNDLLGMVIPRAIGSY